jgi:hypothetical protein
MNDNLKATIAQKLDNMPDETGRQLLDYIEFLESKFNRSTRERSPFERLAENVEGTLRSSKIGEAAVKGTGGIIDVASTVARSFAAAGQAVLDELQDVVGDEEKKEESGKGDEADGGEETGGGTEEVVEGAEESNEAREDASKPTEEGEKSSA